MVALTWAARLSHIQDCHCLVLLTVCLTLDGESRIPGYASARAIMPAGWPIRNSKAWRPTNKQMNKQTNRQTRKHNERISKIARISRKHLAKVGLIRRPVCGSCGASPDASHIEPLRYRNGQVPALPRAAAFARYASCARQGIEN